MVDRRVSTLELTLRDCMSHLRNVRVSSQHTMQNNTFLMINESCTKPTFFTSVTVPTHNQNIPLTFESSTLTGGSGAAPARRGRETSRKRLTNTI